MLQHQSRTLGHSHTPMHVPHQQQVLAHRLQHRHTRNTTNSRSSRSSTCLRAAAKEFQMGTVFSSGKQANWLAPKDDSTAAKGVILFMHGFAQGPNAYYENLRGLADAGWLVVAPEPPFAATQGAQQGAMVEYAAHFHSKLVTNSLTGLPLPSESVATNIVLFGHSVGSGLSTYVAQQAAAAGQPYKAVMYMAPQTQVVDEYCVEKAIKSWPQQYKQYTQFALQYGLKDDLAPPKLSLQLIQDLKDGGLQIKEDTDVFPFSDGTHVGFEDQVVLGDAEVTSDILPWLNPLLLWIITSLSALGVPLLPQLLLGAVYRKQLQAPGGGQMLVNPQDIALLQQQAARRTQSKKQMEEMAQPPPADGLGPTETVKIASAEASTAQYIGLLVVAVAALFNFGAKTLEKWQEQGSVPWLYLIGTLLAGYFTYEGIYYLRLQSYVNTVQRPQSRANAKAFLGRWL